MNVTNSTSNTTLQASNSSKAFATNTNEYVVVSLAKSLKAAIKHANGASDVLGSMTYYIPSYGFACLFMEIILNRTYVWASTNNTRQLMGGRVNMKSRKLGVLILRLTAITVLAYNLYLLLITLDLTWRIDSGHGISNWLEYDPGYWKGTNMATPKSQTMIGPTTVIYWQIFMGFCLSHFVETFISTIERHTPHTMDSATLFEHSIIFHQASLTDGVMKQWYPRPTEPVLVFVIFSVLSHLFNHFGALVNNNKYRLIYSTILSLSSMWSYFWSISKAGFETVNFIIVHIYIPEVWSLSIVIICFLIGLLAYIVNGFELRGLNFASFFEEADWETIDLRLSDDFHTCLSALTALATQAAGKLCYIKELGGVPMVQSVWVERVPKGYNNVLSDNALNLFDDHGRDQKTLKTANRSVILQRLSVIPKSFKTLGVLVVCLVKKLFGSDQIPDFLNKSEEPQLKGIDINELSEEERIKLVLEGEDILELDTSPDFVLDSNESDSELESEGTDIDENLDDENQISENEKDVFNELVSPDTFGSFIQMKELVSHFRNDGKIVTRARYRGLRDESEDIKKIIASRRDYSNEDYDSSYVCVVCHVNNRDVITLPCKCFALCEPCRLALAAKSIQGCVTCRRDVEGFIRVFVP